MSPDTLNNGHKETLIVRVVTSEAAVLELEPPNHRERMGSLSEGLRPVGRRAACKLALLESSQVIPMLLAQELHFENCYPGVL